MKIVNGLYKGKKAVIKNIWENKLFLYNKDFIKTNGMFVDNRSNVLILGASLISEDPFMNKVNLKLIPRNLLAMKGKLVKIINGKWKGYVGFVKEIFENKWRIELTAKNKIVSVNMEDIADDDNAKNDEVTPSVAKTPAYYPQSPSMNVSSPGWMPNTRFELISGRLDEYAEARQFVLAY